MANNTINFTINVQGDANKVVAQLTQNIESLQVGIKKTVNVFSTLPGKIAIFNQVSQSIQGFSNLLAETIKPGAELNASLADLSAMTDVVGEGLQEIEGYAREAAKTFGGSAAQSVEAYKLLLSQLTPELAKAPAALKAMGDNVQILSKTMGGDVAAATEVLTTAMNQYQVSTVDPIEASKEMANMMNVMAAAAKEGSAELPAIKDALSQAGMASKMANVSFVETNAAIQVLDKAGKKGAEGGVALRNVLATLSQGRFLPKDVRDELQNAGVDINVLTDKSKSLAERLKALGPIMNDQALVTKMFGKENNNAALALMSGIDLMEDYAGAIDGTNTAVEQANIVMDSYNERQSRMQAQIDDFKISIFNATNGWSMWLTTIVGTLVPLSQMIPLLGAASKGVVLLGSVLTAGTFTWAGFATVAVGACKAISAAIISIPIIGWIALVIAALIALGVYFWNTSAKFRAVLKGIGAAFVATFTGIWNLAKGVFMGIGDLIRAAFSLDFVGIKKALSGMKNTFSDFGSGVGKAFNTAYDKEMSDSAKEKAKKDAKEKATVPNAMPSGSKAIVPEGGLAGGGQKGGSGQKGVGSDGSESRGSSSGSGTKNITTNINNLVGKVEIHTTNLKEGAGEIKRIISEILVGSTNDLANID